MYGRCGETFGGKRNVLSPENGASRGKQKGVIGDMMTLGGLRDGLLVLGGLIYGLGYVTWILFADVNSLGPLSVLSTQYFVAGIVPAGLVCGSFVVIRWMFGWALRRPSHSRKKTSRWLGYIGGL